MLQGFGKLPSSARPNGIPPPEWLSLTSEQADRVVTVFGGKAGDDLALESTLIRTAMFANSEDRSLICSGNVPQGSKIKFSLPPDFDSIETVVEECKGIKDNAQQQADAMIMFSCVSRYLSFGMVMKEEIEQVQKIWDAPMVGFFSYGEFGKSKTGKNEYHNNTCCIVALKEK